MSLGLWANARVRLKDHAGCPVEEMVEGLGCDERFHTEAQSIPDEGTD